MQNEKSNDDSKKAVHAPKVAEVHENAVTEQDKYPLTRRMLASLDGFLSRRFLSVSGFYFLMMSICATLIVFARPANAAGGGSTEGLSAWEVWLYSVVATLTFLFLLAAIRFVVVKKRNGS